MDNTIASTMEYMTTSQVRVLRDKDVSNFYEQKLKLSEMAVYIDTEIERLTKEAENARYHKRKEVARLIEEDIAKLEHEFRLWAKDQPGLKHWDKLHKKHEVKKRGKGTAHTGYSFTKECQKITAHDTRLREKGRFADPLDITIGNDPVPIFLNNKNPSEANMTGFDVHMAFHIITGWISMPMCKVDVQSSDNYLTLMVFIPQFNTSGIRQEKNKLVYIQLSKDLGVYSWNPANRVFDLEVEQTLDIIRPEFAHYYEMIIEGRAGHDMTDTGNNTCMPGSHQVSRLERIGIEEYFGGKRLNLSEVRGKYYDMAMEKALGEGFFNHTHNIEARKEVASQWKELRAEQAHNKNLQEQWALKIEKERNDRLIEMYKDTELSF